MKAPYEELERRLALVERDRDEARVALAEATRLVDARSRAVEKDPLGKPLNAPGAKADAGKIRPTLVFRGFARALWKVAEVGTYGAAKYTDNGWEHVPNGRERYEDAQLRHMLKTWCGEDRDPDSEIEHLGHEAWNALARLELALREKGFNPYADQSKAQESRPARAGTHQDHHGHPVRQAIFVQGQNAAGGAASTG